MRHQAWLLSLVICIVLQLTGCGYFTRSASSHQDGIIYVTATIGSGGIPQELKCAYCGIISTTLTAKGTWANHTGTSFATPHVSAGAGMLKAQGLTAIQVKNRLLETARPLGLGAGDPHYGAGILDSAAALGATARPAISVTDTIKQINAAKPSSVATLVQRALLSQPMPELTMVFEVKPGFEAELQQALTQKGYAVSRLEYVWVIMGGAELKALADALRKTGYVDKVAVHQTLQVMGLSVNDPFISQQWALQYTTFEQAWEMPANAGLTPITIAVLDTGVDISHPDLQGVNWVAPCSMVASESAIYPANYKMEPPDVAFQQPAQTYCWNQVPQDTRLGHGTAVTGVIAAVRNNHVGISGAGYGVDATGFQIMPVKVISDYGGGTSATIAYGIYYAVEMGADVINLSLGLSPGMTLDADIVMALAHAAEHDVVVVAAAGNNGLDKLSPMASVPSVISVGATSIWSTRAAYSNYGADLDIVAPGGACLNDDLTVMMLASSTGPESGTVNVIGYTSAPVGIRFELPVFAPTPLLACLLLRLVR